jgi:hypothetical protein
MDKGKRREVAEESNLISEAERLEGLPLHRVLNSLKSP